MNRWWIWSVVAALRLCVLVLGSWCAARPVDLSTSGSECVEEPEITLDVSQRCIKYWTLVQQVHRLWTQCVRTSAQIQVWNKRGGFISLSDHLPLDLCPTENKRRTTATCKSYCDHLKAFICFPCGWLRSGFSSEGITIPNKLSLFCCDEEFPPDNVYRSIYPSRKMGLILSGNAFYQAIKTRPDLFNWSRVIVAHRECRKQTLK